MCSHDCPMVHMSMKNVWLWSINMWWEDFTWSNWFRQKRVIVALWVKKNQHWHFFGYKQWSPAWQHSPWLHIFALFYYQVPKMCLVSYLALLLPNGLDKIKESREKLHVNRDNIFKAVIKPDLVQQSWWVGHRSGWTSHNVELLGFPLFFHVEVMYFCILSSITCSSKF